MLVYQQVFMFIKRAVPLAASSVTKKEKKFYKIWHQDTVAELAPALTAKSVGASGLYPLSMMSSSAAGPRLWGSSNMASDTPGLAPSTLIWNWYSRQGLIPETIHLADFPADLWLFEASSQISDDTYKKLRIVAVSRNAENFLRFYGF